MRITLRARLLSAMALSLVFLGATSATAGVQDLKVFKSIPVLDDGRLKPLDTFARSLLTQFSGHDHYGKEEACGWLAAYLFKPDTTVNDKVFLINNPDIATALGMDPQADRRYTPDQLQSSYQKLADLHEAAVKIPESQRTLVENEIIRVFDNYNSYMDVLVSFQRRNNRDPALAVIWEHMADSYRKGDEVAFNIAAHSFSRGVCALLSKEELKKVDRFGLELFYQAVSPFTWSIMFYISAFIFFVISFSSSKPLWYRLGLSSVIAGLFFHMLGLGLRIIIMARPPVTSLYETFVFVGFISVLLGLMIEHYNRQWLGLITAAISGAVFLFIANKYSTEGDTFKVLVAVLDSNFWLATHVTTITIGYAATCVGGLLGHIWLLQAAFGRERQILDKTYSITLGILGVALTLTFLGTNLGGIWADQSWGRFWGWDPKENGALMIVLWTALLFHAKAARMIGQLELAVGAVMGMMVVMWAWFGVNLLNVGLHSYGFTSGVATGLCCYAAGESVFLLVSVGCVVWRKPRITT